MIMVVNLYKAFGNLEVLKGINLEIKKGEVICLIGPSGSGKSTFLRCLNFLERPTSGEIIFNGKSLSDPSVDLNLIRSQMGMVFQEFNLFPHMTVMENVTLGLIKVLKMNGKEAINKATSILKRVDLIDKAQAYPENLSGGQKQRAAIARALAMGPQVMLFDEPTSALDPELVEEVLLVIRDLVKGGMTMVIITHEMGFARDVAHGVVFLDQGIIVEKGTPDQIFNNSRNDRTRRFIRKVLNLR